MATETTTSVDHADDRPDSTTTTDLETTTGTGLEANVAGALSYVFGFLTGILFYVLEPDDEFVRFHAAQSMVLSVAFFAASVAVTIVSMILSVFAFGSSTGIVFGLVSLVVSLLWLGVALGAFVLWLLLMVRTYQGQTMRVPILAGFADRIA